MTKKATPAEIKAAIAKALAEDFRRTGYSSDKLPIPVRTIRLIDQAIDGVTQ